MHLYIIRHCESENNALWRKTGSENGRYADPALTGLGRQQAHILAKFLGTASAQRAAANAHDSEYNNFEITHLYCSLMRRSVETGTPIAQALNLPLVAHADIHERGGIYVKDPQTGVNEGLPGPNREHFEHHHPELILPERLGGEGWWNRSHEDVKEALQRARNFITWFHEEHGGSDDRVAMVTHGGFIQSLFSVMLGSDLDYAAVEPVRDIWIKANNGSISRLDFWDTHVRLTYLNRVDFFPENLIT